MPKDPRVDAYIAKARDFAAPILKRIRAAVHNGHPAVRETIKWGVPAYVDERGIVCMTAAFKNHCAWVFWAGRTPDGIDATGTTAEISVNLPNIPNVVPYPIAIPLIVACASVSGSVGSKMIAPVERDAAATRKLAPVGLAE